LGVVIPAHDEAHGIADTVRGVLAAKQARGVECAVLVVADNCTDDTAERARAAGATVLERTDENLRGKGYALDFAFGHLLEQGVDALIVLDADARVPADFFERAIGARGCSTWRCSRSTSCAPCPANAWASRSASSATASA
jgi:glycosyltransferase involved in cell wall biosynthesis